MTTVWRKLIFSYTAVNLINYDIQPLSLYTQCNLQSPERSARYSLQAAQHIYLLKRAEAFWRTTEAEWGRKFCYLERSKYEFGQKISLQCKYFGFFIFTSYFKQFMFNRLVIAPLLHIFLSCDELPFYRWQKSVSCVTSHPLKTVFSSRSIIFTVVAYETLLQPLKQNNNLLTTNFPDILHHNHFYLFIFKFYAM